MLGSVWFPLSNATATLLSFFREGFWLKYNFCLFMDWDPKDVPSLTSWVEHSIFQSLSFSSWPSLGTKYNHLHLEIDFRKENSSFLPSLFHSFLPFSFSEAYVLFLSLLFLFICLKGNNEFRI